MKRLVLTLALALVSAVPAVADGLQQYILVIEEPSVLRARNAAEPDITRLGGIVEQSWSSRRVIRIPESAVETLRSNPAVRYLQPLSHVAVATSQPLVAAPDTSTPPWNSGDYAYDGAGNVKAIGASVYTYDAVSRLTSAAMHYYASPATTETYQYDGFGNLRQLARAGGATTTIPVDASSNRLLASSAATYDASGNLNSYDGQQFSYDGLNMVVHKTLAGTSSAFEDYLYTADDERVGVRNGQAGTWHWKVRDFGGQVVREFESPASAPAGPWLWVEDYVYRDGTLLTGIREPAEGGQRHFHLDHLGTPRLITNSAAQLVSANDYAPYGIELTPLRQERTDRGYDRVDPMKFTGHERDFTAGTGIENTNYIDYMHARYYSPLWGRFLSLDPKGNGDRSQPQSWNRYLYALDNPMRFIDADGRDVKPIGDAHKLVDHGMTYSLTFRSVYDFAVNDPRIQMFPALEIKPIPGTRAHSKPKVYRSPTTGRIALVVIRPLIPVGNLDEQTVLLAHEIAHAVELIQTDKQLDQRYAAGDRTVHPNPAAGPNAYESDYAEKDIEPRTRSDLAPTPKIPLLPEGANIGTLFILGGRSLKDLVLASPGVKQ